MKAASKPDSLAAPRWYTHRWNSDLSWKLILGIVPRIAPVLRPPLHFVTTLLCFAAMGRERRAARRNLAVVTGRGGAATLWLAFRLFYNFSKFMVAYTDVPPYGDGALGVRLAGRDRGDDLLGRALARGRGVIVLGMHLGQWDLALISLARRGVPITMVMRREDEEAARFAAAARQAAGIRVAFAGADPMMMLDLLAALRRNEIVALQGDRPYGPGAAEVRLFGRPTHVPAGPAELAQASGAPVVPAVLIFEGHRGFRLVFGDPLLPGSGGGPAGAAMVEGVAAAMQDLIHRYPDHWFNFYEVWGARDSGAARPRTGGSACATSR
jgi:KDO2-lipid IV(A) lauroyltransferase